MALQRDAAVVALFLTPGHCTDAPAAHAEIWFASDVDAGIPQNGYPYKGDVGGKVYTHPNYDPNAFYVRDLGVVVLRKAFTMSQYGRLPPVNQLDALSPSASTIFTAVGYGLQQSLPDAAPWKDPAQRVSHGCDAAPPADQHRLHRRPVDPALE